MISLEAKLAQVVEKMKPASRKRLKPVSGNVEATLNIAESILHEDGEARESIRRNNGASGVAESDPRAESDAILMEALSKRDPRLKAVEVSEGSLTAAQKKDYEFCKLLNMSESDAMKVAKSGDIRG